MFKSRCEFSITLAASATLIELALCTPAVTTEAYTAATISNVLVLPRYNLMNRRKTALYPFGLIRSGENPTVKPSPQRSPDSRSKIGTQISSVTPG